MKSTFTFNPTDIVHYVLGKDTLLVRVQNDAEHFLWQLVVNDSASPVSGHYSGILVHKGYAIVTAYYEGSLQPMHPFKIQYARIV